MGLNGFFFFFFGMCASVTCDCRRGVHVLRSECPTDFVPHWDDWLGETSEPVEYWRTGPLYQHLPPQKGSF